MQAAEWKKLIWDWSVLARDRLQKLDDGDYPDYRREFYPDHGYGDFGATEEDISLTEARLGVSLPPSYREFLKATNGLEQPVQELAGMGGDFFPVQEVDWFRDHHSDWIEIWNRDPIEVSDDEYFDYNDDQNTLNLRPSYLKTALAISKDGDSSIYLLIPEVQDTNGEWEAWHFANWMAGAERYRSFEEMMLKRYRRAIYQHPSDCAIGF